MRTLVACGPFEGLSSAQTGAAVARAWAELGSQVAVVPIAESGRGFGQAWADLTDAEDGGWQGVTVHAGPAGVVLRVDIENPAEPHDPTTSERVGVVTSAVLSRAAHEGRALPELWLEVPDFTWADGGAGFWRVLGSLRDRFESTRLHLVTRSAQAELQLTGLRGITAAGALASGAHPGELIAADQALVDFCSELGNPGLGTTPGAGAVGGLGAAVLALGGDVVTGPGECARLAGMAETMRQADLVVVGYDELDFGSKGGDLLPVVTELAEQALRPVVAVARHNWISARELRTMVVEQGYALAPEGAVLDAEGITRACGAIARTWNW